MIISDFKPVFLVLGGLVTKSAFSKTNPIFLDDFFDTKLILWQHPQQVFCYFHHFLSMIFENRLFFSKIWMFLHHHWKFGSFSLKIGGELICQSWPLQTLFSQLSHSALYSLLYWVFQNIYASHWKALIKLLDSSIKQFPFIDSHSTNKQRQLQKQASAAKQ